MPIQSQDIIVVGLFLLPLSSIQHFIWPLSWCLLADICNHTWIPECGRDDLIDELRIFIDECDMFEFNCDHETDYEIVNYQECFAQQTCPPARACPSKPPCPDHRFHRQGDRYVFVTPQRRRAVARRTLAGRRYTPKAKKYRKTATTIPTRTSPMRRSARRVQKSTRRVLPTRTNKLSPSRTKVPTLPTHYELVNYSECFGKILCPPPRKCPSRPPCPDHRFHRMGDKYVFVQPRRQGRRMLGSETTLPMRMMKGKRRYTPEKAKRRKQRTRITTTARTRPKGYPTRHTWAGKKAYTSLTTTQRTTTTTTTTTFKMQTIILKRETIFRAGRRLVKIVKGIAWKSGKPMNLVENVVEKSDSDFLE